MTITVKEIKEIFHEWNNKAFNGNLPEPYFEVIYASSFLGKFSEKDNKISISIYYDRPYKYFVTTIVHEMIHYYIWYYHIFDTSPHGPQWKKIANNVNKKFGLDISRASAVGGDVSDFIKQKKVASSSKKEECVVVCKLNDVKHKYAAAVVPRDSLKLYKREFKEWGLVSSFKFVIAPYSETFDLKHLRSGVSVRYISEEHYKRLWKLNGININ